MTSSTMSRAPSRCVRARRRGEIAGRGRNATGIADDGLEDDRGDGSGVRGEGGFDGGDVVVGQGVREARDLLGYAGRAGDSEGRDAGSGFDQQAIGVAVIAAFKLDDDLAAGGGAGEADG